MKKADKLYKDAEDAKNHREKSYAKWKKISAIKQQMQMQISMI